MSDILLVRSGTLVAVSPDGQSPCPNAVEDILAPYMQYDHKENLRGQPVYHPITGERVTIRTTKRYLYRRDGYGRLCTGSGFIPRIVWELSAAGYTVRCVDVSPAPRREGCYDPDWENVERRITYRPRQKECLQAIVKHSSGLINATFGFGKTFLYVAIALLFPRARIDIVVKQIDLVEKIVRRLKDFMPEIGQVGGGQRRHGRVVVYSADSLHHSDGDADILLCEEAHQLLAPTYSEQIARTYRWSRNYAFTGTPEGRFDGGDVKMEMLFGPEIFRLSYQEAVRLGIVVPITVSWVPVYLDRNPVQGYKHATAKKRWGVWRNHERNAIVAQTAREVPDDEQTLILLESIEHAVYLHQFLPEYELCYGQMDTSSLASYKANGLLSRDYQPVDAAKRRWLRESFESGQLKKVIATDVWATGVDFPSLSELVRADERDSPILSGQGPPRVSRICEEHGKEHGRVRDFIDQFDERLRRKSLGRKRVYEKYGWHQEWNEGQRVDD